MIMRRAPFYVFTGITLFCLLSFSFNRVLKTNFDIANHQPDVEFIRQVEKILKVTPDPKYIYSYDTMNVGVYQHLDRNYTYDVIPEELRNGILFQGIHRPDSGTSLKIELFKPMIIYFFFHYEVDGGYKEIFSDLEGWEKCDTAPQYDIHNGDHGLKMYMYKRDADKGIYNVPPTLKAKACFNIVFQERNNKK